MKKILLLLLLISCVFAGCIEVKSKRKDIRYSLGCQHIYYAPNGCEYYIYGNGHGGIPLHKQDCQVCLERHKQELLELIKVLKNDSIY